jgi:polar amino acid transport system substrate-binding protein
MMSRTVAVSGFRIAQVAACAAMVAAGWIGASHDVLAQSKGAAAMKAPLPAALRDQKEFRVGVRCDYPSRGTVDASGRNVGIEPDMARKMAEYAFGDASKVAFTCVTAESRIPFLTSNRVDFLIATLGNTPARAKVIDFSESYFASFGKMLTRAEVPAFTKLEGGMNKTILAVTGTPYGEFAQKCLKASDVRQFKTVSDAVTDLVNDRGFGFIHDSSAINTIAANNPKVRINGPDLDIGFATSIGVRKGDDDLRAWINEALGRMQAEDWFASVVNTYFSTDLERADTLKVIRRPNQTPDYSKYTGTVNC